MYTSLRGKLIEIGPSKIVLDVQGVGYGIHFPQSKVAQLPPLGSELFVFTTFVLREFSMSLFGFLERSDRDLFEVLLNVSGIGPKTALSIISFLSLSMLQHAVQSNDVRLLSQTPGIGKKTAERLIVELKGKLDEVTSPSTPARLTDSRHQEALSALIHLGYPPKNAEMALAEVTSQLKEDCDLPTLITAALRTQFKRS